MEKLIEQYKKETGMKCSVITESGIYHTCHFVEWLVGKIESLEMDLEAIHYEEKEDVR